MLLLTKCLAVASMLTCAGSALAQELVVRIGHVAPTSGAIAHLGLDNEYGVRLAIEELNAQGVTLGGRKVRLELLSEDDAADPKQAVVVAHKLVDAAVSGVIGHSNSGTTLPASKIYFDAGIPQISPSATHPKYTRQGFNTAFRVVADDVHLGGALGRYAVDQLRGRAIVTIDDRTAYGQGVADEFAKAVRASGGHIQAAQYTTDKSTDFSALLTALKTTRPDIVFFGGMDAVAGPMLRQMRQLGIHARLMGGDGICSTELPELSAGAVGDGQVVCAEAGGVDASGRARMDRFRAAFMKRFGVEVQSYAPYAYDAVKVMVAAMVKAGSAEPARYLPFLARTNHYQGVTGTISFDGRGDLTDGALTLYTYRENRREELTVVH